MTKLTKAHRKVEVLCKLAEHLHFSVSFVHIRVNFYNVVRSYSDYFEDGWYCFDTLDRQRVGLY